MAFELIIRGGMLYDGTGSPPRLGDLGVSGGKITALGDLEGQRAARYIEAPGLAVAPGFIDIHSHSDVAVLKSGRVDSKIRQGVTLEVVGNCGDSCVPLLGPAAQRARPALAEAGLDLDWTGLSGYMGKVMEQGCSANVATFVGHGTLRDCVFGIEDRAPTPAELNAMRALLRRELDQGAFGFSTGLIYPPGCYTTTDELLALAQELAPCGGIYATHLRSEGDYLLEAVAEAIAIGKGAGVSVQISHHKCAGKANRGRISEAVALEDEACAAGLDISMDAYPYTAGATDLASCIPPWTRVGGAMATVERLRDSRVRARIRKELEAGLTGWENLVKHAGWGGILVTSTRNPSNAGVSGQTLQQIADTRGNDVCETLFDLLVEESGEAGIVLFMMDEGDVRFVLRHARTMGGSDASARCPETTPAATKPHPRAYGTFARILGPCVREEGLWPLETAVHKLTGLPAAKLRLTDRGRLNPGAWADVVVFDPATVRDRATYLEPSQYPAGVEHVLVNGVVTVEAGEHTGARAGRPVLRPGT